MTSTEKYHVTLPAGSTLYVELSQTLVENGCVVEGRTADPDQGTVGVEATDDGIVVLGAHDAVSKATEAFHGRFNVAVEVTAQQ